MANFKKTVRTSLYKLYGNILSIYPRNSHWKHLYLTFMFLFFMVESTFCKATNTTKNIKETYIIRYFEDLKVVPVKVELDSKEETEHVTVLDSKNNWIPVSFHDFRTGKVAYKDTNSSHCFIADLNQETLDHDRKRLKQLNVGVVKGFYIPTFFILNELDNTTNISVEVGVRIAEFCHGSSLSYVSKRNPLLSRKKRQIPPSQPGNGQKGQFTHHSYGHYGHQSNNYAHYGHETRITGVVDKDGTIKDHRMSQYQERSQGSQILPVTGIGNDQQIRTNGRGSPHYSSFSSPSNSFGVNIDQQGGTGNTGQFSLQSGHESGYRLNLPLGLTGGNTYKSAISSKGQYDTGRIHPHRVSDHKTIPIGPAVQGYPGLPSSHLTQTRYPTSSDISRTPSHGMGVGSDNKFIRHEPHRITSNGHQRGSTEQVGSWPHSIDSTGTHPSLTGIPSGTYIPGQIAEHGLSKDSYRTGIGGQNGRTVSGQLPGLQPGSKSQGYPREILSGSSIHPGISSSGNQLGLHSGFAVPGYDSRLQAGSSTSQTQPGSFIPQRQPDIQPAFSIAGPSSQPKSTFDGFPLGSSFPGYQPGQQPSSTIPGYTPSTHPGQVAFGYPPGTHPGSIIQGQKYELTGNQLESQPGTKISGYQPGSQHGPFISGYEPRAQPEASINGIPIVTQPGSSIPHDRLGSQPGSTVTGSESRRQSGSIVTGHQPHIQSGSAANGDQRGTQLGIVRTGYEPSSQSTSTADKLLPGSQSLYSRTHPSHISRDEQRTVNGIYPSGSVGTPTSFTGNGQQGYIQGPSDNQLRGQQIRATSGGPRTINGPISIDERYRPGLLAHTSQGRPRTIESGDSASSQTQIQTGVEGTAAEASSAGKFRGLGSQTQVQGGYSGNGSFSAQAQSGFTGGVSQSQVQGGKQGGLSGSSAIVENLGSAQSQVQIGKPSGSASSSAQGRFSQGMTQVNAQSSRSGGSAGAESQSKGRSSSQVHVNIAGGENGEKNGFQGTVSASVHGGHSSGQSQTQLQGGFNSGRTYVATAQGGFDSSADFQGSVPLSGSLPVLQGSGSNILTPLSMKRNGNLTQISQIPITGISSQIPTIQNGSFLTPGVIDRTRTQATPGSSTFSETRNGQIVRPNGNIYFDQRGASQYPLGPGSYMPHRQIHDQRVPTGISYPSHHLSLQPVSGLSGHRPGQEERLVPDTQRHLETPSDLSQARYPVGIAYPSLQQQSVGMPGRSVMTQPHQIYLPQTSSNMTSFLQPSADTVLREIPSHQLPFQPQGGYQPSSVHSSLPGSTQTEFRNNLPGSFHPSYPSLQPPSHQISLTPPGTQTGFPQPSYIPGSFQPSAYFPSSVTGESPGNGGQTLLPKIDFSRPTGTSDSSATQNGHSDYFPGSPHIPPQIPIHHTSLVPSGPQTGFQQPSYVPGSFQPSSYYPSSATGESPGGEGQPSVPKSDYSRPTATGDSSATQNGHQDRIPSRTSNGHVPHSVQRPSVSDQDKENCCDALNTLRKRCCGTSSQRKNGDSLRKDFTTDFTDDISDENNGEPCKVVKAICYIVYKPVGKARICKPTTTNGC